MSESKLREADLEAAKKDATAGEVPFRTVAFSADNLELAVAGDDKLVHTFNAETGLPAKIYAGQVGAVLAVAYQPTASSSRPRPTRAPSFSTRWPNGVGSERSAAGRIHP